MAAVTLLGRWRQRIRGSRLFLATHRTWSSLEPQSQERRSQYRPSSRHLIPQQGWGGTHLIQKVRQHREDRQSSPQGKPSVLTRPKSSCRFWWESHSLCIWTNSKEKSHFWGPEKLYSCPDIWIPSFEDQKSSTRPRPLHPRIWSPRKLLLQHCILFSLCVFSFFFLLHSSQSFYFII